MRKRPKLATADEVIRLMDDGRKIDAAVRRAIHAVTRPKTRRAKRSTKKRSR